MIHDLQSLPCLSGLRDRDLVGIAQISELKKIHKSDILFTEDDSVKFFFIVKTGMIKLYKTSREGKELIVKIMKAGDYLCCAPIYSGGRYFLNAVATEKSTLIMIPADSFKEILSGNLGQMGLMIISGLCSKIKYLSDLVENLTFRDVEQRVALVLMKLAGERAHGDHTAFISITHQEIASMTGTVREVVSRIMSKMKKNGVISSSSAGGFTVDRDKLALLLDKDHPK